jgi:hypothetical protein
MNTAFGGPEELPFDLRTRRHPIQYNLEAPDDPNRKAVLTEMSDRLKVAFRAIIQGEAASARVAAAAATLRQAAEERMQGVREQFVEDALRGRFYRFEPERGAILLTMLPETPLSPLLNLGDPSCRAIRLATISGEPQPCDLYGRKLVVSHLDAKGEKAIAVTELRDDGSILAADGSLLGVDPGGRFEQRYGNNVMGFVPSIAFEQYLAKAIVRYLQVVRTLGVRGPVYVTISLFRVQGFIMATDDLTMMMTQGTRKFEGDEGIQPDPVILADGAVLNTVEDAAQILKPAFDFVWREFGYAGSLNFDRTGAWRSSPPHLRGRG